MNKQEKEAIEWENRFFYRSVRDENGKIFGLERYEIQFEINDVYIIKKHSVTTHDDIRAG